MDRSLSGEPPKEHHGDGGKADGGSDQFAIVFAAMGVNMETAHFFKQVCGAPVGEVHWQQLGSDSVLYVCWQWRQFRMHHGWEQLAGLGRNGIIRCCLGGSNNKQGVVPAVSHIPLLAMFVFAGFRGERVPGAHCAVPEPCQRPHNRAHHHTAYCTHHGRVPGVRVRVPRAGAFVLSLRRIDMRALVLVCCN